MEHLYPEGVHLRTLGQRVAKLRVRKIAAQPTHRPKPEIEAETPSSFEGRRHALRPHCLWIEHVEAVRCSDGICGMAQLGNVYSRVAVQRRARPTLGREQPEGLQHALAEHRGQENVKRVAGVERAAPHQPSTTGPATELAHVERRLNQMERHASSLDDASEPSQMRRPPPCSPLAQLRSSVTVVVR